MNATTEQEVEKGSAEERVDAEVLQQVDLILEEAEAPLAEALQALRFP